MNDMSQVIIPKSDQWNADDFIAGPATFTISEVRISPGSEQPVSIVLEGTDKFYRPCKSMSRVLVQAWGPDAKAYIGRSLTLYLDPTVKWAGIEVGGIRISHMSHIEGEKQMMLTATKGSRKPFKVRPLATSKAPAAPPQDDPAAKWAGGFIANLAEFTTVDAVQQFADQKAAKLTELANARPDLHEKVTAAIAARKAELGGGASTFDDDDLNSETVTEQQSEKSAAEEAADKVIAEADAATTLPALEKIIKDAEPHLFAMPDDLQIRLETAFSRNRTRLEAQGELAK